MSLSVCRFRSFFFFLTSGTLSWVSGSDMMFYCFDSSGTLVMYMLCLLYLSSISVSSCFVPDPFWLFVPFLLFQIFPPFLHCLSFDFFFNFLFIFGYAGLWLLHRLFSGCGARGWTSAGCLLSPRSAGSRARASGAVARPRAALLCGTWARPTSGAEPVSSALVGGFFTTEPPEQP